MPRCGIPMVARFRVWWGTEYSIQGASLRGRHTKVHDRLWVQTSDLKMPRALPPFSRKTTQAPHTWVYRKCTWYLIFAMYVYGMYMSVPKLVTTTLFMSLRWRLSPGWRLGTDTGCAGLELAGCRWVQKTVLNTHTASSSVEHVVEVTAKRLLFLVTSVTPISTLKKYSLDGGPSQG